MRTFMVISKGGRFSLLYRGLASECYRLYKLNPVFLKYFEFEPSRVQTKKTTFSYIFFDIDQSQTPFRFSSRSSSGFPLINLNNLRIKSPICLIPSILYRLIPKSSPPVILPNSRVRVSIRSLKTLRIL